LIAGRARRAIIDSVALSPLSRVLGRALDVALPARCAGCGREGLPICPSCEPALDARLELPAGVMIGLPADLPEPLVQLEWCAPYTGTVRRALHELKYSGEQRLAGPLGAAIARRWARAGAGGDLVVPVPVHRDRLRHRGYDQALLLATVAARDLRLPIASLLERGRATMAQFDLDRAARATNMQGAFRLRRQVAIDGRWIVLVDDVVTTGATLAACAVPLMVAGALAVSAVTVARER
jgi:ComF family protein